MVLRTTQPRSSKLLLLMPIVAPSAVSLHATSNRNNNSVTVEPLHSVVNMQQVYLPAAIATDKVQGKRTSAKLGQKSGCKMQHSPCLHVAIEVVDLLVRLLAVDCPFKICRIEFFSYSHSRDRVNLCFGGREQARGHLPLLEVGLPINIGRLDVADPCRVTRLQQQDVRWNSLV